MTDAEVKPPRCRHGNVWVYAPVGTGSGQIHWCYRCGAIRQTDGDRAYRWTRPVGPIGEEPGDEGGEAMMSQSDVEAMIRNLHARLELVEAKFDHPALAEMMKPELLKEPTAVTNRERWLASEVERLATVAEMRRDEADRERLERRDMERWLRSIKEKLRPWWSDYGSNWDGSLEGLPIVVESIARKFAERERLWGDCENFVEEQFITGSEAILQRDAVMQAAPDFIERICETVGYAEPNEGED